MAVTMADITKLRTQTGAGMMDCKNALNEAEGDFDKAIELLRKRGQALAAKRAGNEASEGCVLAGVNGGFGAIVALKCETDFVAVNENFVSLTKQILSVALENKPATIEELNAIVVDGRTIAEYITERSGTTGEKMEIGYYETVTAASVAPYIHPGNKLATLVGFNLADVDAQVGKDVAMQAAAMNPVALNKDEVPAELAEKEFNIARDKAREEGKPENMLDKIAQGRMNKFYAESTLVEQAFIKDSKMSVAAYLKASNNELVATAFRRVTLNVD
ncbi:MAG: translation elongation factor Ts [Bacteroidales bacterium]